MCVCVCVCVRRRVSGDLAFWDVRGRWWLWPPKSTFPLEPMSFSTQTLQRPIEFSEFPSTLAQRADAITCKGFGSSQGFSSRGF